MTFSLSTHLISSTSRFLNDVLHINPIRAIRRHRFDDCHFGSSIFIARTFRVVQYSIRVHTCCFKLHRLSYSCLRAAVNSFHHCKIVNWLYYIVLTWFLNMFYIDIPKSNSFIRNDSTQNLTKCLVKVP